MVLPNTMIIGAQKCGTTWLHRALDKSEHFSGSQKKELNHWNKKKRNAEEYEGHFQDIPPSAKYIYESTPHYFRLPTPRLDIAAEIRKGLGDIPLILLLRDPVERYLSAYTHHIMQGRLPVVDAIDEVRDDHGLFSLGDYYPILKHFQAHFSKIHIFLYDDIVRDPEALVQAIFAAYDLPVDIGFDDINFRTNDKKKKRKRIKENGIVFPNGLPVLTPGVRSALRDRYRDGVVKLRDEVGLDVGHWVSD